MALISAPDAAPTPPAAGRGRVLGPGTRYTLSRVLSSAGTLVFVILFNFFLFRLLPGDPIALYTRGRDVDPEIRRQMQAKFNAPIAEQFVQYIKNPFVPELPSQQFSSSTGVALSMYFVTLKSWMFTLPAVTPPPMPAWELCDMPHDHASTSTSFLCFESTDSPSIPSSFRNKSTAITILSF